jgi:hypothetical protein
MTPAITSASVVASIDVPAPSAIAAPNAFTT